MSQAAGIEYRFGPSASEISSPVGNGSLPTLYARNAPTQLGSPAPNYQYFWQVGGPVSGNAGSYSSNWAQMLFVADNPSQRVGVTDMQVTTYMYNTFAQLPQLSWTLTSIAGGGLDQANVLADKNAGMVSGNPVATGRCEGHPGFCPESLTVFQNGLIVSGGPNTATNNTTVQLPSNKVPTAIAMTNDSEFALVTVWDTAALQGQVAVVALAGLCDGCNPYNNGTNGYRAYYSWWNEWMQAYPGLPNMGDIAFMKILGYVNLPGMAAPTGIAVTTGLDQYQTMQVGGIFVGQGATPLTSNWQSFTGSGANAGTYAKGGVAVVTSKSEQKVAFVDLKPLFSYLNGIYFSSNGAQANNLGQAANQWPYTFAQAPAQTPTVISTVSLANPPTAVKTNMAGGTMRAWVATQDGTLHIYSLGGYAPGGQAASPSPSDIAEVGQVTGIGRNPTSLATSKGEPSNGGVDSVNQQVLVASRGDRTINWVRFASDGNSGSIVRTLRDTRLADPIAVEDSDNFANTGYTLSVTDYNGRQLSNYRYGPVIFSDGGSCPAPNGCAVQPTGSDAIEYAGSMAVPGAPFQITTANVP
jgi:hypothetical protein